MKTIIYMVRHGDSPKEGNERTRGLSERGKIDAQQIAECFQGEKMDRIVSSPYQRSILTLDPLSKKLGQEIIIYEDLKERMFLAEDKRIPDNDLDPLLKRSFEEPEFRLTGGESNAECQKRAVKVLKELLEIYQGGKIVIGSHGAVMTLMMGSFDRRYDLSFLQKISKPDIYRMEFVGQELVNVYRLWREIRPV